MPLILTFFGALVFGLGLKKEFEGGNAPWKWVGLAIVGFAGMLGYTSFNAYFGSGAESQLYKSALIGNRMKVAHAMALILPVMGIIGCVIANFVVSARKSAPAFDE